LVTFAVLGLAKRLYVQPVIILKHQTQF